MKNTKSRSKPRTSKPKHPPASLSAMLKCGRLLNHPALKNPFGDVLRSSDDLPFDNSEGLFVHVLVDLPRIKIFRTPDGFLVDREGNDDIQVGADGWYSKPYVRELLSRELALHRLLVSVVPDEFADLLKPLAIELEIAHDITQANLKEEIV